MGEVSGRIFKSDSLFFNSFRSVMNFWRWIYGCSQNGALILHPILFGYSESPYTAKLALVTHTQLVSKIIVVWFRQPNHIRVLFFLKCIFWSEWLWCFKTSRTRVSFARTRVQSSNHQMLLNQGIYFGFEIFLIAFLVIYFLKPKIISHEILINFYIFNSLMIGYFIHIQHILPSFHSE